MSRRGAAGLVAPLDTAARQLPQLGPKAAVLSRLVREGYRMPAGFCIGPAAWRDFRAGVAAQLEEILSELRPDDVTTARAVQAAIRDQIDAQPLAAELERAILDAYAHLGGGSPIGVAVRSAATGEDGAELSYAGQYHTSLDVRGGAALLRAVKRGFASLYSASALLYRQRFQIATVPWMSLLVQRMLACDVAGVLFTRDPVHPSCGRMRIEAVRGLASRLVDGRGADAAWTLDRLGVSPPQLERSLSLETPLDPAKLEELRQLGLALEARLCTAVDVEWGLACREIHLLQVRPTTAAG